MSRPSKPPRIVRIRDREFWYVADGRKRYSTKTSDEEAAECFLAEYIATKEMPLAPTVSKLLDMRLANLKAAKKSRAAKTPSYHNSLIKHFGNLQSHQVTQALINSYWKKRSGSPGALREELMELKTTFRMAVQEGFTDKAPRIDLPAKGQPRDRFLTRDQARSLLDAARPTHLRIYLLIAMTTGARKGAILGLTWDRVDFKRGRLDFTDPERALTNKRRTVVPVSQEVIAALRMAKEMAQTSFVIEYMGRRIKDIRRAFNDAAEKAGLSWATPHTLKHSVISWLAEAKFTVDQISDMTATSPGTIRRIYRKYSPDYLEPMATSLSETISFTNQFAKPAISKSN